MKMIEERSRLFNIEPKGINTAYIESLSSYINRLASNHCVLSGTMVQKILTPVLNKRYLNNIAKKGGDGFYKSSYGINGVGGLAKDFVKVLEDLSTRNDLEKTTMLCLSEVFPTRGLSKSNKSWCTACYNEMKVSGDVYEPLLWSFEGVKVCPRHKIKLEEQCPLCNKKLNVLDRCSNPGYCSKCLSWLGKSCDDCLLSNEEVDQLLNQACLIRDLLDWIVRNDSNLILKREDSITSLNWVVNEFFGASITEAAAKLGFKKTTLRYWIKGINRPPINAIVKVCLAIGISMEEFYLKRKGVIRLQHTRNSNENTEKIVRDRLNHVAIANLLSLIIDKSIVISIKRISNIIGCDRRFISRLFPNECQEIIANNKEQITSKMNTRNRNITMKIEGAFFSLTQINEYPSIRKMEALLGERVLQEVQFKEVYNGLVKLLDEYYDLFP